MGKALELTYGFKPGKISFMKTAPESVTIRDDPYVEIEFLELLKQKGEVIFVYEEDKGNVYRY